MNCVFLIGRLTKDPEIRCIPKSETTVASFVLAVDRPHAKEKTADFIKVTVFGKTAELCERYLVKGLQVGIQGRIQTGSYKTEAGDTRNTTEVYADKVQFLEWKTRETEQQKPEAVLPPGLEEDDDDIPF